MCPCNFWMLRLERTRVDDGVLRASAAPVVVLGAALRISRVRDCRLEFRRASSRAGNVLPTRQRRQTHTTRANWGLRSKAGLVYRSGATRRRISRNGNYVNFANSKVTITYIIRTTDDHSHFGCVISGVRPNVPEILKAHHALSASRYFGGQSMIASTGTFVISESFHASAIEHRRDLLRTLDRCDCLMPARRASSI